MTKKNIAGIFVIVTFLSVGNYALAEEGSVRSNSGGKFEIRNTSTETRADVRANIEIRGQGNEEKRGIMREMFEGKRDEKRLNVEAFIRAHTSFMERRMTATVERLEKIADRIDSRIEKMKNDGENTEEAEGFVVEARASLRLATENISKISTTLEAGILAQELRGAFGDLRNLVIEIKENIMEAKESLRKAVASLSQETSVEIRSSTKSEVRVQ